MEEDSVSTAVVAVVARDKGVDPMDLPPLASAIDPDALESVVETGRSDGAVFYVEFEFADRIVTIDDCEVSVRRHGS